MEPFTEKVLESYGAIDDERVRALVRKLISHLHACVRDLRPSDEEWEFAWDFMKRMADCTGSERNEFLLLADVLGVSQLIENLNHETPGQPVGHTLLGPFFRAGAPLRARGASIASDDTAGDRVRMNGRVTDAETGEPLREAALETWQAATNGFYENQDETQLDYNLRGRFITAADGSFELVALMPTAYPVPTDGPVGELLRAAHRPPNRPGHIHFVVSHPGYETLVTQIFVEGDDQVAEDVVYTASANMIGRFRHVGDHYELRYDFPLRPGISTTPKAPVTA